MSMIWYLQGIQADSFEGRRGITITDEVRVKRAIKIIAMQFPRFGKLVHEVPGDNAIMQNEDAIIMQKADRLPEIKSNTIID